VLNIGLPRLSIFHIRPSRSVFESLQDCIPTNGSSLNLSHVTSQLCDLSRSASAKDTRNDGMESQNTSSSSPEEAHLLSSGVFKKMLFLVSAERVKTESGQSSKSRAARDWTAACVGDSKNLCYFPESLLAFANRSISTVLRVHKLSLDGAAEGFCFGFGLFRG
jgi:hypothetical protein